jgi:hypothetical protein
MRVKLAKVITGPLIISGPLLSLSALFLTSFYFDRGVHLVTGSALELRAR